MKGQGRWKKESAGVKQSPAKASEQGSRDLSAWEVETEMRTVMKAAQRKCKEVQRQETAVPQDIHNP